MLTYLRKFTTNLLPVILSIFAVFSMSPWTMEVGQTITIPGNVRM